MYTSLVPLAGVAAFGRSTQPGSPARLHVPASSATASQYPWFVFHESTRPSPALLFAVVLMMLAPQDTQPCWLLLGVTTTVAKSECSAIRFEVGPKKVQV